jgi:hypothetical protein
VECLQAPWQQDRLSSVGQWLDGNFHQEGIFDGTKARMFDGFDEAWDLRCLGGKVVVLGRWREKWIDPTLTLRMETNESAVFAATKHPSISSSNNTWNWWIDETKIINQPSKAIEIPKVGS